MALIDALIELSLEAGEAILAIYARDFAVTHKDDDSPVTEADLEAERIILKGLHAAAPTIPVVAEESVAAGRIPPPCTEFFLVDPLDGSKEFISRNGEFTVNIALVRDGVPVLGVVYAPALGRIWWGGEGAPASAARVIGGKLADITPIRCTGPAQAGHRVVGSRSHGTRELDDFLGTIEVAEFVPAGSSLKFCLLAEGKADLYPRFGRTMEWDTAAGDAVLRAAGGQVVTLGDNPLTYGKRDQATDSDFANPNFLARTHSG